MRMFFHFVQNATSPAMPLPTWHDGTFRKVAREKVVVDCDALVANGVLAFFPCNYAIHQQKREPAGGGVWRRMVKGSHTSWRRLWNYQPKAWLAM